VTVSEVLTVAQSAGIKLEARGQKLYVQGPSGSVTAELKAVLAALKPDLLAVLDRLQSMRHLAKIAPRPCVYARAWAKGGQGYCFSCGDRLEPPATYGRCTPCEIAADLFFATTSDNGRDVEIFG
jgi:hypothetical protein